MTPQVFDPETDLYGTCETCRRSHVLIEPYTADPHGPRDRTGRIIQRPTCRECMDDPAVRELVNNTIGRQNAPEA